MKQYVSRGFLVLGVILCGLTVWLAASNIQKEAVLAAEPERAYAQVETLMAGVCGGDYEAIEQVLYGGIDLGMEPLPETELGQALQACYRSRLRYGVLEGCSVTDTGIGVQVQVTAVDLAVLTEMLAERVKEMPAGAETEDSIRLWCQALEALKEEEIPLADQTVTVKLVKDGKVWKILPETELLGLISGIPQ